MDSEQFREQITQRYVTGKTLDGASLDEIAKGMTDPVEQMNYLTGQPKMNPTPSTQGTGAGGFFLLVFLALLALLGLCIHW
jgi:hypothetical protein